MSLEPNVSGIFTQPLEEPEEGMAGETGQEVLETQVVEPVNPEDQEEAVQETQQDADKEGEAEEGDDKAEDEKGGDEQEGEQDEGTQKKPSTKVKKQQLKKPAASKPKAKKSMPAAPPKVSAKGGGKGPPAKASGKAAAMQPPSKAPSKAKAKAAMPQEAIAKPPVPAKQSSVLAQQAVPKPPVPAKPTVPEKPNTSKSGPLKRPAAAPSKTQSLAANFELEEEEEVENPQAQEGEGEETGEGAGKESGDGRDRSKARKLTQMLKSGTLTAAAKEAWQACHTRGEATEFINSLFERSETGALVLKDNFVAPKHYAQSRVMARETKAEDQASGYGKLLFLKKHGLTEAELTMALASGEVKSWNHNGLTLYSAVNITYSSSAVKTNEEKLLAESTLDHDGGAALARTFDLMEPNVTPNAPVADKTQSKQSPRSNVYGISPHKYSFIPQVLAYNPHNY